MTGTSLVPRRSNLEEGRGVASYPGIPIWRRGEEEHLVHTVVRMRLISEKSRKMGYPGNFPCNGDVTFVEFLQPQYSLV